VGELLPAACESLCMHNDEFSADRWRDIAITVMVLAEQRAVTSPASAGRNPQ